MITDWTTGISESGMHVISDVFTFRPWTATEREHMADFIADTLFDGAGCKGVTGSFVLTELVFELD